MSHLGKESARQVSVVVPIFNRLDLLRTTVESLRAQTLRNAEFILVDDRSDANVAEYLATLPTIDKRFKVFRKPDNIARGSQSSRNYGMDVALGDAILFLDSDDLLAPDCLKARYAAMNDGDHSDIVVGRQAIIEIGSDRLLWVNTSSADAELDRFLRLARPLDVPWVNGGALLRRESLVRNNVRWRPEFAWDDVAFHFECLAAGFTVSWMDREGGPDSFYRRHDSDRFGSELFRPTGMRSTVNMLAWMRDTLLSNSQLTTTRMSSITNNLFHTCVLRAVDMGEFRLAEELVRNAQSKSLVNGTAACDMIAYAKGRKLLRRSSRASYYWNRVAIWSFLSPWYSVAPSTYATLPVRPVGT